MIGAPPYMDPDVPSEVWQGYDLGGLLSQDPWGYIYSFGEDLCLRFPYSTYSRMTVYCN